MNIPRTFVVGDIHGAYQALLQCVERSEFDYANDHLICLGDVCDGWPETRQAIDELLKIKNLTYILGNHDSWALTWMQEGAIDTLWLKQGGEATVKSYAGGVPPEHIAFLKNARYFFLFNNKLFVHAGIDPFTSIENQDPHLFLWDRQFAETALMLHSKKAHHRLTSFDEVYIGHTPIPPPPIRACEVWFMDTGAGWSGKLSMMNIETKEIFMSDSVPGLYPGVAGRKKRG